jgi:hypothetical protein
MGLWCGSEKKSSGELSNGGRGGEIHNPDPGSPRIRGRIGDPGKLIRDDS